jgi:hypothetical protein
MRALVRCIALACALFVWSAAADDDWGGWKQRLDAAQVDVDKAREREAAALEAYQHMRHDRSARGPEKAKILAERADAEHAVGDAQARLEALREEARRAGAPAGLLLPPPPAQPGGDS